MKRNKRFLIGIIALLLTCLIFICGLGIILFDPLSSFSTPTPFVFIPIETIVMQTYEAARFQTLSVSTPLPLATYTLQPSPSATCTITVVPTWTPIPTFTPFVLNTLPPPIDPDCVCTQDTYNCGDPLALTCYSVCISKGYGDIHGLDWDNDGYPCED